MLTSAFTALQRITSCHFGPMSAIPLATNSAEVSVAGTDSINFLDPSINFSWTPFFDISAALGAKSAWATFKHVDGMPIGVSAATPGRSLADTTWYAANGHRDLFGEFCTQSRARLGSVGALLEVGDAYRFGLSGNTFNAAYVNAIKAQLAELLTNYGIIDYIILDAWGNTWGTGSAPTFTDIPLATLNNYVTSLQAGCLIINNDHNDAYGDIRCYEAPVDGEPKSGISKPVIYCRTLTLANKWFTHSDTAAEADTAKSAIYAKLAENRAILRGYVMSHNFSPGPDGLITPSTWDVVNKMQNLRIPSQWNGLQNSWNMEAGSGQAELDQAYFVETTPQTTLSVSGTPGSAAGKLGNARVLSSGNNFVAALSNNNPPYSPLSPGNRSFTFIGWCKPSSFTSFDAVFGKDNNGGNLCEYLLYTNTASGNTPTWRCSHDGATLNDVAAVVNVSAGTYYFFMVGHDAELDQIFIQINGGTRTTKAHNAAGIVASVGKFSVGSRDPNGLPMAGQIDGLHLIMDKALSAAEGLALYNGGAGSLTLGTAFTGNTQNIRNILQQSGAYNV